MPRLQRALMRMAMTTTKMVKQRIWKVASLSRLTAGLQPCSAQLDVSLSFSEYEESGLLETDEVGTAPNEWRRQVIVPLHSVCLCRQPWTPAR